MTDSNANKDVVRRWFNALSEQRYDDAWALMSDDSEYWVLRQRASVPIEQFAPLFIGHMERTFADGMRFTPDELTAEDDRVSATADGVATMLDGTAFDNKYHFLFTVREGGIALVREYGDTYRSWQAFGGAG